MLGAEEFYFVKVQGRAANLANVQRGFGEHLMFLRVLAIKGHVCPVSSMGFVLQKGGIKGPFHLWDKRN